MIVLKQFKLEIHQRARGSQPQNSQIVIEESLTKLKDENTYFELQ